MVALTTIYITAINISKRTDYLYLKAKGGFGKLRLHDFSLQHVSCRRASERPYLFR
jgi:hypothetical protein